MKSLRSTSTNTRVSAAAGKGAMKVRELYVVVEAYQALLASRGYPSVLALSAEPLATTDAKVELRQALLTIRYAPAKTSALPARPAASPADADDDEEPAQPPTKAAAHPPAAASATASAPALPAPSALCDFVVNLASGVSTDLNEKALHRIAHRHLLSALRDAVTSNMEGRDAEDPAWMKFTQILKQKIPDHESPYARVKDVMLADAIRKAGLTPCVKVAPCESRESLSGGIMTGSVITIVIGATSESITYPIFREYNPKSFGKGNEASLEALHKVNPEIEPCYLHMMILAYLGKQELKAGSKAKAMFDFLASRVIG
jgi:hypothetical protein